MCSVVDEDFLIKTANILDTAKFYILLTINHFSF